MTVPPGVLDELQREFVESALIRLRTMSALLDRLASGERDRTVLLELLRHFHGLVGMGATCGVPKVTMIAERGETSVTSYRRRKSLPPPRQVEQWRGIVTELEHALREQAAAIAGSNCAS